MSCTGDTKMKPLLSERFFWTSEQMVMLDVLQELCGAQLGNRREGAGSAGARVHPMEGAAGGRGWRVSSEGSPSGTFTKDRIKGVRRLLWNHSKSSLLNTTPWTTSRGLLHDRIRTSPMHQGVLTSILRTLCDTTEDFKCTFIERLTWEVTALASGNSD